MLGTLHTLLIGKIEVEPILKNKRILKRKRQFNELCQDKSQILQPVQIFSKAIKIAFDQILSEIKTRVNRAVTSNLNYAFLNDHEILNMSTEEKKRADLVRKYEQDLNTFEFSPQLFNLIPSSKRLFYSFLISDFKFNDCCRRAPNSTRKAVNQMRSYKACSSTNSAHTCTYRLTYLTHKIY